MNSIETKAHRPVSTPDRSGLVLPAIFTLTIFLSASLLFFVQPLFAKMVLPHIGGAPAVWTTAMLFFQVVLLGGYLYAHVLSRCVDLRWQLPVHLCFWAAALFFLPLSVSTDWVYDPQGSTTWQTLIIFALGVGVPFGMLSANAPLLQSWYARTNGPSASDPYFLYGASNTGSLLALLGFPLLAEPLFGAEAIGLGWAMGFLGFGACLTASGVLALQNPARQSPEHHTASVPSPRASQIACWLFLAFVPSALMLSITTKVSTDMGSFPLVWVVPLALYILSFVITFTNRPLFPERLLTTLGAASLAIMAIVIGGQASGLPTWISALLFIPTLFILATVAHRKLYSLRPDAAHLTVFYITMSVGGALGGLFNSIIAPAVFDGISEGWISVLCAAAIGLIGARTVSMRPVLLALIVVAVALTGFSQIRGAQDAQDLLAFALMAAFAIALGGFARHPAAVFAAIAAFLVTDAVSVRDSLLFKDRSFFGAHTVRDIDDLRIYGNGTTVHGIQRVSELSERPTPLSYYHPESPMAQVLTTSDGIDTARIAIVGLGVGSLACYGKPGQTWHYYEIDETVDRVARNPALFGFMTHCAPGSDTHLGDARIVLSRQDLTFDIMVLDAYSSDSIPLHLLTVEAVQLYLDRLAPDGQLVFHISNRYYDLSQPLARIAQALGLQAAIRVDRAEDHIDQGARASVVVTLSRAPNRIEKLVDSGEWSPLVSDGQTPWTDDRAHVLSALRR